MALNDGWDWIWIDTCCIDKRSSAELSEAINSMYLWYREAQVCYAYLSDVCINVDTGEPFYQHVYKTFHESRWFRRGWTLQELLAPQSVVFYDRKWTELGTRSSLEHEVSLATGISIEFLNQPLTASVAQKMFWASRRETTRIEDTAYCLLGIFDVNMPLLYGEGPKAFQRLQEEILKVNADTSLFAWADKTPKKVMYCSSMLAGSPAHFIDSGNIVQKAALKSLQWVLPYNSAPS